MKQAIKRLLVLFLAFLIAICNSFTFVVYAEGDQSTSETDPSFVKEESANMTKLMLRKNQ